MPHVIEDYTPHNPAAFDRFQTFCENVLAEEGPIPTALAFHYALTLLSIDLPTTDPLYQFHEGLADLIDTFAQSTGVEV